MTVATVRQSLIDLLEFLDAVGAKSQVADIQKLIDFLEPYKSVATVAFLKKANPTTAVPSSWTGHKAAVVVNILEPYANLTEKFIGKKKVAELFSLIGWLADHGASDLDALLAAAQQQYEVKPAAKKKSKKSAETDFALVEKYAAALKSALGNDKEFAPTLNSLKTDKSARKEEVSEIAKRISSSMPSNMARAKALQAINDLHRAAMGFSLKMKAMGGRTAA